MIPTAALARAVTVSPLTPAAGGAAPAVLAAAARAAQGALVDGFTDAAFQAGAAALGALTGRKVTVAKASRKGAAKSGTKPPAKPKPPASAYPRELAFLDDKKMSVQEKIFRLLLHFQEKADREMDKKLKEYTEALKRKEDGKKGGGVMGAFMSVIKEALPGLEITFELLDTPAGRALASQLSGPVLAAAATALGAPALAPVLAAAGPDLVGQAVEAYRKAEGASSPASKDSKAEDPADEKRLGAELQYLQERQKAMTSLLSNTMRAMHETSMAVIQNIR